MEKSKSKKIAFGIIAAVIIASMVYVFALNDYVIGCDIEVDPDCDDNIKKRHDSVSSGPLSVTQYEHRLGENVFFNINGLLPTEKGTIEVYTPKGVLFKTIQYDGSVKPNFNQYFKPDTLAVQNICTKDDLVGEWVAIFTNNEYMPLKFVMVDEFIIGGEKDIVPVC